MRISANPHTIALDERIGRVYVLSDDTTLSVIDTRTGALLATRTLRPFTGGFVGYGIGVDAPVGRVIVCEGGRARATGPAPMPNFVRRSRCDQASEMGRGIGRNDMVQTPHRLYAHAEH